MQPLPVEPVEIEYQTPQDSPWQPMVRLMAAAAIGLGITHSFNWAMNFTWLTMNSQRLSGLLLVYWTVQLSEALCGVGLAIGGAMVWSNVRRGRLAVITFAAILVIVTVAMQSFYLAAPIFTHAVIIRSVGALETAVLPAVMCVFFRRPEVVAVMPRDQRV